MPFYFCKGCTTGSHKQRETELFITVTLYLCSWARETMSVIWQHLQYFSPRGSVGVAVAKIYTI